MLRFLYVEQSLRNIMDIQRRLLAYLKPHWKTTLIGLLCAAVASSIPAIVASFLRITIDAMNSGKMENLRLMCGLVILLFIVKGIFGFGQNYMLSLTANRVAADLRADIFEHLHTLSLSYFNKRRKGAIMSTLTGDVPVLQNATMSMKDLVSSPLSIIVSVAALLWLSWWLTLISLVCIPFMAFVIQRISRRIRKISTAIQTRISELTTTMEETVSGVRIVKSFASEETVIARFLMENQATLRAVMQGVKRSAQLRPILEVIGAGGIALVLLLGGGAVARTTNYQKTREAKILQIGLPLLPPELRDEWSDGQGHELNGQALIDHQRARREKLHDLGEASLPSEWKPKVPTGGMTQGDLLAFLLLLDQVARTAGDIGGLFSVRAQALSAGKRIFDEVLGVEPDVKERDNPIVLDNLKGNIRFEQVSFRYAADSEDVLHDLNFEVKPGEVVALVGEAGSGKSTIVDLIPRFYDPTQGRILIDGVDLRDLHIRSLRRQIGIVPQDTFLFAGTLRDNIAYGNREATESEIMGAAIDANARFIENSPDGLDTVVSDRGVRLSGGERQRVAIARAILLKPKMLILDEATASLDSSSEALVQEALERLMKGRTTIVIAHRLSTIINADRIIALKSGRIVESGTHRELLSAGGYYARLYETQLRGYDEKT